LQARDLSHQNILRQFASQELQREQKFFFPLQEMPSWRKVVSLAISATDKVFKGKIFHQKTFLLEGLPPSMRICNIRTKFKETTPLRIAMPAPFSIQRGNINQAHHKALSSHQSLA
jgi:hypothetical protein